MSDETLIRAYAEGRKDERQSLLQMLPALLHKLGEEQSTYALQSACNECAALVEKMLQEKL